jgi:hypothetical protein
MSVDSSTGEYALIKNPQTTDNVTWTWTRSEDDKTVIIYEIQSGISL